MISHPRHNQPTTDNSDSVQSSRTLAIALIVSAVLLLIAAGVVIWLLLSGGGTVVNKSARKNAANDTSNVTKVEFVAPADLPAAYVKNDQSTLSATNIYYYDDATNCGITVGVALIPSGKTITDVMGDTTASIFAKGVTTTKSTKGDTYAIKDVDGKNTYAFDSLELEQNVKVDGVAFTGQNNIVAYKQFGLQAATLGYACKTETWPDKKAELAGFIKEFTVKTER